MWDPTSCSAVLQQKGKTIPLQAWTGPKGSTRLRPSIFQDSRHMMAVSLSALSTGRLYSPGNIPGSLLSRTAVAQWLRCCATNRKVACSFPFSVSGFFVEIKSFRSHYGPRVDSASNRNEYQEYFLGVKAAGA